MALISYIDETPGKRVAYLSSFTLEASGTRFQSPCFGHSLKTLGFLTAATCACLKKLEGNNDGVSLSMMTIESHPTAL